MHVNMFTYHEVTSGYGILVHWLVVSVPASYTCTYVIVLIKVYEILPSISKVKFKNSVGTNLHTYLTILFSYKYVI